MRVWKNWISLFNHQQQESFMEIWHLDKLFPVCILLGFLLSNKKEITQLQNKSFWPSVLKVKNWVPYHCISKI